MKLDKPKALIYTFKSFPYKNNISESYPFEFHKINEDLEIFSKLIFKITPKFIIGVAKSSNKSSRFETKTVNIFNKTKKVSSFGKDSYLLSYPESGFNSIKLNSSVTSSFCNMTMFKISQLVENKNIKLQFIHIAKKDLVLLQEYLSCFETVVI